MFRRPGPPLQLALLCAAALAVTGVLAKLVPLTQQGDARTLNGFVDANAPRLGPALNAIAHLADPAPYALAGVALALVALLRGRRRVALSILVLFLVTGATTAGLKHLLASPHAGEWLGGDDQISEASWPSGHATAAMTMALCAILAAPPRLRPTVAAVGGAFAIAVAYAILTLGWHFPSDVVGGFLVAATYTLLAIAALAVGDQRAPTRTRGRPEASVRPVDVVPALAIAMVAAGAAIGLALARPHALADYAETHTTFTVGIAVVALLGTVLAAVMAAGLRGSRRGGSTAAPRRR